MVEINYVKFGVANVIDNKIYLNEHLNEPEFESLKNKIIIHEKEHLNSSWMKNRKIDALSEVKFSDLKPFFKKYPKALFQYLPITYINKVIYFEWSLILFYLLGLGVLYFIYLLINTFSSNQVFFWKIVKNILIILPIVFVLYFLGKKLTKSINKQAKEIK
jgi:hypothetical protein